MDWKDLGAMQPTFKSEIRQLVDLHRQPYCLASMNTTARVITFGTISGLVWSGIAACLSGFNKVDGTVLIAGILTGILVSLALKSPLQRFGKWSGLVFGVLSLPTGAFIFGVVISLVQLAASRITGSSDFPFINPASNPIQTGIMYAILSILSLFVIALLPLAVLTTFILRAVIHRHEPAA